jgi:CBS domain-containing protein
MHAKTILAQKGADIVTVSPETSVADVARLFKENRIGFAVVRHEDVRGFVGTVSERDIIHGLAEDPSVATQPVSSVLTGNIVTCTPETTVNDMMELMTESRTRHLLVMDGRELKGIVSIGDLIKTQIVQVQMEAEAMRDYVQGAGYH